jgi:hypothetical protein
MSNGMVNVNLHIDNYSNRVLNVIKAKFGLKDKSKALMYFVNKYGEEFVEPEIKEEYIKEIDEIEKKHLKKYGLRHQSLESLRKEIEEEQ